MSTQAPHVPPSLGSNALEVWRAWRDLTAQGGENGRIEALSVGMGTYQWREGKLWRLWKVERLPLREQVGKTEEDELWRGVCNGWVQVYLPACRGLYPERVLHQSTGQAIPESAE